MGWRALCTAAVLLAFAVSARAAALPDLDVLVSYETRQVGANGITRTETWQERVTRRGDTVWTERVLPAHEPAAEPAGHKHFDFDRAARWLQRDANGQMQLRYVDREHRVVVSVPKAEYGAVGFDGRWDAAASIVPATVVERMSAAQGRAGAAQWRTEQAQGWSHRVLWSASKQVALRIESRRDDGGARRVVTAVPVAARGLPWQGVEAYAQKEYDDFMD